MSTHPCSKSVNRPTPVWYPRTFARGIDHSVILMRDGSMCEPVMNRKLRGCLLRLQAVRIFVPPARCAHLVQRFYLIARPCSPRDFWEVVAASSALLASSCNQPCLPMRFKEVVAASGTLLASSSKDSPYCAALFIIALSGDC